MWIKRNDQELSYYIKKEKSSNDKEAFIIISITSIVMSIIYGYGWIVSRNIIMESSGHQFSLRRFLFGLFVIPMVLFIFKKMFIKVALMIRTSFVKIALMENGVIPG